MGAAYFYHLTRNPLEHTLRLLLGKALQAGMRCAVVGGDETRRAALDAALWLGDETGFLPHGLAGGPYDVAQPILISETVFEANTPSCLMMIEGAEITAELTRAKDRICILFDGNDDAAVQHARVQWKTLVDAGCAAQYWSEETGSWVKKAERSEVS